MLHNSFRPRLGIGSYGGRGRFLRNEHRYNNFMKTGRLRKENFNKILAKPLLKNTIKKSYCCNPTPWPGYYGIKPIKTGYGLPRARRSKIW